MHISRLSYQARLSLAAFVFFLCLRPLRAQSSSAPLNKPATVALPCPIRTTPLSSADIAFAQDKFSDAADLYRKDSEASGPDADRAHNGLIRALLKAGKVDEADADARAWIEKAPNSSWAFASLDEVQYRQGAMDKVIASIQTAGRLGRCNMQVHLDFARFSELTGMYATAKAHLDLAHTYDPLNDEIEGDWIILQPRSVQLDELTRYLDRSKFITDKERKSLEKWKDSLTHPSAPCHLTSSVASTTIPFHGIKDGPEGAVSWGLLVGFNGSERRLEIDTGASGLLLSHRAATALHLKPEFETASWGLGDEGAQKSYIARVHDIQIGGLHFEDCYVDVLESDTAVLEAQDGLIGGDVFSDFLLTLDFPGRELKLDPLPEVPGVASAGSSLATGSNSDRPVHDAYIAPAMQNWSAIFRVGHQMILPVQPNSGPVRLFIVDTGADETLISPKAAKSVTKVYKSGVEFHGISGSTDKVFMTGPLELHFAGLRYPTNGIYSLDTTKFSNANGIEISGFLGAGILRRLTMRIDYRDDLVNFSYDPKRLTPCMPGIYREDCYD